MRKKKEIFPHLEISQLSQRSAFIQLLEKRKKNKKQEKPFSREMRGAGIGFTCLEKPFPPLQPLPGSNAR